MLFYPAFGRPPLPRLRAWLKPPAGAPSQQRPAALGASAGSLRRAGGLGERGLGRRAAFGASFSFLGSDWRTATCRRGAGIFFSTCPCHAN